MNHTQKLKLAKQLVQTARSLMKTAGPSKLSQAINTWCMNWLHMAIESTEEEVVMAHVEDVQTMMKVRFLMENRKMAEAVALVRNMNQGTRIRLGDEILTALGLPLRTG